MKNMIETFMKEEQAIFIVALCLLLFAIVMGYAMVQDYRIYLDENYKAPVISSREEDSISICFSDRLSSSSWDLQYI